MIENKGRKKNEDKIIDEKNEDKIIDEENEDKIIDEKNEDKIIDEENEDKIIDEENENIVKNSSKRLVALTPILYLTHQYKIGDELPTNNLQMVSLWLEAGTAKWK